MTRTETSVRVFAASDFAVQRMFDQDVCEFAPRQLLYRLSRHRAPPWLPEASLETGCLPDSVFFI